MHFVVEKGEATKNVNDGGFGGATKVCVGERKITQIRKGPLKRSLRYVLGNVFI